MAERLTVLDEAQPEGIRSTPRGSEVQELLVVYQQVLDTVDDLPLLPMVLHKHAGRLHYLPRVKWPVRYFVVRHVRRTLADLNRRYSGRVALGRAANGEQQDREAVRDFQQSLPPDRQRLCIALLIAVIVVFSQLIMRGYLQLVKIGSDLSEQFRQHFSDMENNVGGLVKPDVSSINGALNAVVTNGFGPLIFLTLCVALAAYVALRPLVPAFRLKRTLLNLAPEPGRRRPSATARWSDSHATGLYERENRVFATLGTRPPREFPFDLAASALALAFLAGFCALTYWSAVTSPFDAPGVPGEVVADIRIASFAVATCLLILILLRLGWMYRTWRRRQVGRALLYMPFEVRIRGGTAIAKVEGPLGLRLFLCLLLVGYLGLDNLFAPMGATYFDAFVFASMDALAGWLLISLPWWYRVNRELRDLDHTYGSRHGSSRPLVSVLMMAVGSAVAFPPWGWIIAVFVGYLPFIAVFRLGRHIRRAQARAGRPVMVLSPWILAPGLLLAPVLFVYIQKQLNRIWAVEGQLLDPWPATASWEANWSTGTLPWLKAPNGRTAEPSGAWRASTPAWNHPNGSADGHGEMRPREHVEVPNPVD